MALIPWHAAAKHNALEPYHPAKLAPRLVKPLAYAEAVVSWINANFGAVKHVAVWIVARAEAAAGDLVLGMLPQRRGFIDNAGGAIANDLILIFGNKHAFGKVIDLAKNLGGRIGVLGRVNARRKDGYFLRFVQLGIACGEFG